MAASKDPNVIGSHYEVDGEVYTRIPRVRRTNRVIHEDHAKRLERKANEKMNQVEQNFTELSIGESYGSPAGRAAGGSLTNFYPSWDKNGQSSSNCTINGRSINDFEIARFGHMTSNKEGCRVNFQDSSSFYDQLSIRDSFSDNGGRQVMMQGAGGMALNGPSIGVSATYLQQMIQQICQALDLTFTELNITKIIDRINELKTSQSVSFQTQTWMNERNNLHKKITILEESVIEKKDVIKALNLDIQDLKQVESHQLNKIELLEAQLKESSLNASKTMRDLLDCKAEFDSFENDLNTRFNQQEEKVKELESKINSLTSERAQLTQDLENCKSTNVDLNQEKDAITAKLNSSTQTHSEEKAQWEKKLRHFKKQMNEKDTKMESLANQVVTIKMKCNRKLTAMENEHNLELDTYAVEIEILRNIINKYFESGNRNVSGSTVSRSPLPVISPPSAVLPKSISAAPTRSKSLCIPKHTTTANTAKSSSSNFQPLSSSAAIKPLPTTSSTLYLHQLYEDRYMHALKQCKDLADSNTIYNSTLTNLLNIHAHYYTKVFANHERLGYFKLLIKEFLILGKILKSGTGSNGSGSGSNGTGNSGSGSGTGDWNLIKKLIEIDAGLMSDVCKLLK